MKQNNQKSVAVMQPYIFPYLGYFQLISAVDKFVFYDDVNFIKSGWINRNQLLNKNEQLKFTIPLDKPSSFKAINEIEINFNFYSKWKDKFFKTLEQTYSKAPYFKEVYPLIQEILKIEKDTNIATLAMESNIKVCEFLDIKTKFTVSSEEFSTSKSYDRKNRLIHICNSVEASKYINALGGQELYNKEDFKKEGVDLFFLKPELKSYPQFDNEFIPGLSIIDVLMFNNIENIKEMLYQYELI